MNNMLSKKPFIGLRSFNYNEIDIFFGRESLVDDLVDKLGEHHFLAVTGVSGCGKSSLVHTGLVQALQSGYMVNVSTKWKIIEIRPANQPIVNLAKGVLSHIPKERRFEGDVELLISKIRRSPIAFIEYINENREIFQGNLLIIVDQFEELFRYQKEDDSSSATQLVNLLIESSKQRDVPIYNVITMRSDFLGDCAIFEGLPEIINESQFLTPRLTREECKMAIEEPIIAVFGGEIEPKLVNRILNDIGADPDQLPLMQHTLMRLWDIVKDDDSPKLTLVEYEKIGGLELALDNHANEIYNKLNEKDKILAKKIFICITEQDAQSRGIRKPLLLEKISTIINEDIDKLIPIIEQFRKESVNFLLPTSSEKLLPTTIIDITHESLIRQWKQLKQWVDDEAKSFMFYRHLEYASQQYYKNMSALWRDPDLSQALKWRKTRKPTAAWADRSDEEFNLVMDFLEKSNKNKFIQNIIFLSIASILFFLFLFYMFNDGKKHQEEYSEKVKKYKIQIESLPQKNLIKAKFRALKAIELAPSEKLKKDASVTYNSIFTPKLLSYENALEDNLFCSQKQPIAKVINKVFMKYYILPGYQIKNNQSLNDYNLICYKNKKDSKYIIAKWEKVGTNTRFENNSTINKIEVSDNGKYFLTLPYNNCKIEQQIILWDNKGRKKKLPHQECIIGAKFTKDNKNIISYGFNGTIKLWAIDGRLLKIYRDKNSTKDEVISSVTFDDKKILIASGRIWGINKRIPSKGVIRLWNLDNNKSAIKSIFDKNYIYKTEIDKTEIEIIKGKIKNKEDFMSNLLGHTSLNKFLLYGWGENIRFFNKDFIENNNSKIAHKGIIKYLNITKDKSAFVTVQSDESIDGNTKISFYNIDNNSKRKMIPFSDEIRNISYSNNEKKLLVCSKKDVKILDIASENIVFSIKGKGKFKKYKYNYAQYLKNNKSLLVLSERQTDSNITLIQVELWDIKNNTMFFKKTFNTKKIGYIGKDNIKLSKDEKRLYITSTKGYIEPLELNNTIPLSFNKINLQVESAIYLDENNNNMHTLSVKDRNILIQIQQTNNPKKLMELYYEMEQYLFKNQKYIEYAKEFLKQKKGFIQDKDLAKIYLNISLSYYKEEAYRNAMIYINKAYDLDIYKTDSSLYHEILKQKVKLYEVYERVKELKVLTRYETTTHEKDEELNKILNNYILKNALDDLFKRYGINIDLNNSN